MCGICGIINFRNKPVQEAPVREMMRVMKHRGPDDEGVFHDVNIALGFVRLSILDLTPAGHQPMFSPDSRYVVVFNGEIYNYLELREELKKLGHVFHSGSDTEVLLAAYRQWGENCLDRLNGMWAFVIYDTVEKTLFASRDRFGIKPFYYYLDDDEFIFASEITPLLKIRPRLRQTNDTIIFDYLLTNRTNHTGNTFFSEILKLQHGSKITMNIETRNVSIRSWYSLNDCQTPGYTSAGQFRDDFKTAVNLQLRSDVPVGLSLSGGIDSSSIGATISRLLGRTDIHSFSAVYSKGDAGDESEFINEFKGYIDNIHFTHPSVESFLSEMNLFVSALEEPVPGTSEYAEIKVMELAGKHCTVLLNGQGADEYMAGYHYLIGFYLKQRFNELRWAEMLNDIYRYYKTHQSFYPLQTAAFYMLPGWIKKAVYFRKNSFISNDFYNEYSKHKDNFIIDKLYSSKTLRESFINHFEYKFEHNLLWADKSGMKFSLETRFPFLDHNIVEKTINTDPGLIYAGGKTKIILRDSMNGILPEKVRSRIDKVGFQTPEDSWFRDERFQFFFEELLNSSSFLSRPYFDISKVRQLYEKHQAGTNNGHNLWKIIHLELWLREFID
jgi:asparagine synthase (glutamine-hydrolysing)